MRHLIALTLICLGIGCGGGGAAPPAMLSVNPDAAMAMDGRVCSEVVFCIADCTKKLNPGCALHCCEGLNDSVCKKIQKTATCALLNCGLEVLTPPKLPFCLAKSCSKEFAECGGLEDPLKED